MGGGSGLSPYSSRVNRSVLSERNDAIPEMSFGYYDIMYMSYYVKICDLS